MFSFRPYSLQRTDGRPGRRYRAFIHCLGKIPVPDGDPDEASLYRALADQKDERFTALPFSYITAIDPELHVGLQDLGWHINWDIHEACAAFDNEQCWYPGVDPPDIEPVSDDLVARVIPALQRELNRELRSFGSVNLPAVPLAQLPGRVQRAIVERRRWRFKQWGLSEANRKSGVWSLWDVPEDEDWVPPWVGA